MGTTKRTADFFQIGDLVEMVEVDGQTSQRTSYLGEVVRIHLPSNEVAVTWRGNTIGATQNILAPRLRLAYRA